MLILIVIVYQNINEITTVNYFSTDEDSEEANEATLKRIKMVYEAFMCIIFESWKCVLILNAVIEVNSLLIYSIIGLSVFSFVIDLSIAIEYAKLTGSTSAEETNLIEINKKLAIACACVAFTFIAPNIWISRKVVKEFGWGIYKKIGASMKLQKMYRISQCFSMILRLNVIFELAYVALVMSNLGDYASLGFTVTIPIVIFLSIVLVREAIARESHLLMILFYCAQATLIATIIVILSVPVDGLPLGAFFFTYWYAFAIYTLMALLFCLATIILGILSQINFGRGLKQYVQWSFYGLRSAHKRKAPETSSKVEESPDLQMKLETIDVE
ncbi:hypothetical protein K501DRAFT_281608 [Backusella circina FSU 941]|nr:hypothetical protein K501DRAFT_281608 [Backusella circina FSU 941]